MNDQNKFKLFRRKTEETKNKVAVVLDTEPVNKTMLSRLLTEFNFYRDVRNKYAKLTGRNH
jgi:hypothetical protein